MENCNVENNPSESKEEIEKQKLFYECQSCKYITNRKFNLDRHEKRIHEELKQKYLCCGEEISTKGEYYLHVETYHPETRPKADISRNKYKIIAQEKETITILIDTTETITDEILAKLTSDQLAYLEDINFDDFPRL